MRVKGSAISEVVVNDDQKSLLVMEEVFKCLGKSMPSDFGKYDIDKYVEKDGKIYHISTGYGPYDTDYTCLGETNERISLLFRTAKELLKMYF